MEKLMVIIFVILVCAPWPVIMFLCMWEYSFKDIIRDIIYMIKESRNERE